MSKSFEQHESYVAGHGQTVTLERKAIANLITPDVLSKLTELKETLADSRRMEEANKSKGHVKK